MRKKYFIFLFCLPFCCFSQIVEDFSDGNFTENPKWWGVTEKFKVNADFQLQSSANETSKSFLLTASEAFENASWELWVKINCPVSGFNYARIYLTTDRADSITNSNAYYVQIGGKNKNISLNCQQRGKTAVQTILKGEKNRLDSVSIDLKIKVTRSEEGHFEVYSKFSNEDDFLLEGEGDNNKILQAKYFGLMFSNTSQTGASYYFDSIRVAGNKIIDTIPPFLESWEIESKHFLRLNFSEPMDFTQAVFTLENYSGILLSQSPSSDLSSLLLKFSDDFEQGIVYRFSAEKLSDTSGNDMIQPNFDFALTETPQVADIVINELLFETEEGEYEYIEIFNKSNKIFDASEIFFATRKSDLKLSPLISVAKGTIFPPQTYLAVTENAEAVRKRYACPEDSRIVELKSWNRLTDEKGTLLITNKEKDIIFDELCYERNWHHPLLVFTRGVALERISALLPTQSSDSWHSAASTVSSGTPGYKNSQYRELNASESEKKELWVDPEAFSPDNDGNNDVCFIYYRTEETGYLANLAIFNAGGVKLIQLASNSLLESEGRFVWDGRNSQGQLVNTGIYLLYFEIFNPKKGKKKVFKRPIVVSAR